MTNTIKKEMLNAKERLNSEGFEKKLSVLERHIRIFGNNLSLEEPQIDEIVEDQEMATVSPEWGLTDHLNNIFREIAYISNPGSGQHRPVGSDGNDRGYQGGSVSIGSLHSHRDDR